MKVWAIPALSMFMLLLVSSGCRSMQVEKPFSRAEQRAYCGAEIKREQSTYKIGALVSSEEEVRQHFFRTGNSDLGYDFFDSPKTRVVAGVGAAVCTTPLWLAAMTLGGPVGGGTALYTVFVLLPSGIAAASLAGYALTDQRNTVINEFNAREKEACGTSGRSRP